MFIRVNRTPNSPRKSIQIVENKRVGNTTKQTILYYVGVAADAAMEEHLKLVAQEIIEKFEAARALHAELFPHLVPPGKKLGRKKIKKLDDILSEDDKENAQDIKEEKIVIDGVNEIAGSVYDEIGYSKLLSKSNDLLKDLVLAQLVYPQSKHKLWQMLVEKFDKDYDLNKIYRILDKLHPYISDVKALTRETVAKKPMAISVILMDVTTLKMSTVSSEDGISNTSDGDLEDSALAKHAKPVVLVMATNEHGVPIEYEVFSGKVPNIREVVAVVDYWRKNFTIDSVCFIGDEVVFTDDSTTFLEQHGYSYMKIVAPKMLPELYPQLLDENSYLANSSDQSSVAWVGEFAHGDCRVLSLYESTSSANAPFLGANKLRAKTRSHKDVVWNGLKCVVTNSRDNVQELLTRYQHFSETMGAFTISKNKTRSTRHWNANRIEAHVLLCYMAFVVLKLTQYKVALKQKYYSVGQLLDLMLSVQSSIHVNKKTGERYKLPGPISAAARSLYKAFNLVRSRDATVYSN